MKMYLQIISSTLAHFVAVVYVKFSQPIYELSQLLVNFLNFCFRSNKHHVARLLFKNYLSPDFLQVFHAS